MKFLLSLLLLAGFSAPVYAGGMPTVELGATACLSAVRMRFPKATVEFAASSRNADHTVSTLIAGDIFKGNIPFIYNAKCKFGVHGATIQFHAKKDTRVKA